MGYAVWITKGGIKVIDALEVVSKENAEVLFSVARNSADNATPIVEGALDVDLFSELVAAASNNPNEYIKKSFAATLGALAAVATLPLGPAMALAADQAFSEAFERAYESANAWSRRLNWSPLFDLIDQAVSPSVQTHFRTSQLSASPLILDLDGDGIEITQHTGAITFDHDANGIETGTAWAGADDGLLVLDRDGNGSIDSGRELFGNNTLLANREKAASDAAFASLRVWRDLDEDGNVFDRLCANSNVPRVLVAS